MAIVSIDHVRKTGADYVISLGCACEVAYNLRRYFNFNSAFPFDWWISSARGIASILASGDTASIYHPGELVLERDRSAVRNKKLALLLVHEFPRETDLPGNPVIEKYGEHIERPMQRTAALFDRMADIFEGARVVFLRKVNNPAEGADDTKALLNSLEQRFPKVEFSVVFLNPNFAGSDFPEPHVVEMPLEAGFGWRGNPAAWDDVLGKLAIRLIPGRHKPFAGGPQTMSGH